MKRLPRVVVHIIAPFWSNCVYRATCKHEAGGEQTVNRLCRRSIGTRNPGESAEPIQEVLMRTGVCSRRDSCCKSCLPFLRLILSHTHTHMLSQSSVEQKGSGQGGVETARRRCFVLIPWCSCQFLPQLTPINIICRGPP